MKKIIVLIILCFAIVITEKVYSVDNLPPIPTSKDMKGYVTPGANEVFINHSGVEMPINKIALVRYKGKHCAVIFTKFWHEKDEKGEFSTYASYDVYYQKDGSGDFTKNNVKYSKEVASFLPKKGGHYFARQLGKPLIQCGSMEVSWDYQGFLCFFPYAKQRGEYGIELAPTPWESISDVNIHHPNIKWFKYDITREGKTIPINELWGNEGQQRLIK